MLQMESRLFRLRRTILLASSRLFVLLSSGCRSQNRVMELSLRRQLTTPCLPLWSS